MRIPVSAASEVGKKFNCRQAIVLLWDGKLTHIVTWGKSADDCSQAADGGNMLKERWGWPECNAQPSRVRKLEARIKELESLYDALEERDCQCKCAAHDSDWSQNPRSNGICLFIKHLRQSGEPLTGPGEIPCEKITCKRCAALAKARGKA